MAICFNPKEKNLDTTKMFFRDNNLREKRKTYVKSKYLEYKKLLNNH